MLYLVVRGDVGVSPTMPNYIEALKSMGFEVCVIAQSDVHGRCNGARFISVRSSRWKILDYLIFGYIAKRLIKSQVTSDDFVWIARLDTAISVGKIKGILRKNLILDLHEIHDKYPVHRFLLSRSIKQYGEIIVNEENRRWYIKTLFNLDAVPRLVYNKFLEHPRNIPKDDQSPILEFASGRKIFIYQGSLFPDRDLDPLLQGLWKYRNDICVLIMGRDTHNRVSAWVKRYGGMVYYAGYKISPDHLKITALADVGLAVYDTKSLNNVYCAPNKIWEYAGYGIPILAQDIPGLRSTVGAFEIGVCVDLESQESIHTGVSAILDNYLELKRNCCKAFDSVHITSQLQFLM